MPTSQNGQTHSKWSKTHRHQPTNCLSVFDPSVRLTIKGSKTIFPKFCFLKTTLSIHQFLSKLQQKLKLPCDAIFANFFYVHLFKTLSYCGMESLFPKWLMPSYLKPFFSLFKKNISYFNL